MSVSFNGDSTCFAIGNINSFSVYNCNPFSIRFKRKIDKAIKIVEPLFRSNFVAYVTKTDPNILVIWDEYQGKEIADLEFDSDIRAIRWKRNIIVIITSIQVYLYNFENMKLLKSWEICSNNYAIALANMPISTFAFPNGKDIIIYKQGVEKTISNAHLHPIIAMDITNDGSILATVSEKGTLIKLWNTETGEKLKELRRGIDGAIINCLKFDVNGERLLVTSEKDTIHIFSLLSNENKKSSLSSITGYLPAYFSSEWSMITITMSANSWCSFDNNKTDTIYIITKNGEFKICKYSIDENSSITIASHKI